MLQERQIRIPRHQHDQRRPKRHHGLTPRRKVVTINMDDHPSVNHSVSRERGCDMTVKVIQRNIITVGHDWYSVQTDRHSRLGLPTVTTCYINYANDRMLQLIEL